MCSIIWFNVGTQFDLQWTTVLLQIINFTLVLCECSHRKCSSCHMQLTPNQKCKQLHGLVGEIAGHHRCWARVWALARVAPRDFASCTKTCETWTAGKRWAFEDRLQRFRVAGAAGHQGRSCCERADFLAILTGAELGITWLYFSVAGVLRLTLEDKKTPNALVTKPRVRWRILQFEVPDILRFECFKMHFCRKSWRLPMAFS